MIIDLYKENIEDIKDILKYLLDSGVYGVIEINIPKKENTKSTKKSKNKFEKSPESHTKSTPFMLKIPDKINNLNSGTPYINKRTETIGTWGMFNTFNTGKALLRVIANLITEKNQQIISIDDIVKTSMKAFKQYGLSKYRGFPKEDKTSSKGRLVSHFMGTMQEMGLIEIKENNLNLKGLSYVHQDNWESVFLSITNEGLEFAKLKNNLFDEGSNNQRLTEEEVRWILNWLKIIDNKGYKEYSFLKSLYEFLKEKTRTKDDILLWFKEYKTFLDYWKSESQKIKKGDEDGFRIQMENLSTTFMSSKIALLRELGFIANKRNDYSVIGDWI